MKMAGYSRILRGNQTDDHYLPEAIYHPLEGQIAAQQQRNSDGEPGIGFQGGWLISFSGFGYGDEPSQAFGCSARWFAKIGSGIEQVQIW
jgi:hypothetical protein